LVKIVIDGKEVEVEEGLSVLELAEKIGVKIPTLCYHPAVSAYGACRVCIVEVIEKGLSKLTTSCTCPVESGIEVKTNSEKIKKTRKLIVEMLLARCPDARIIQNLAKQVGVEKIRAPQKNENCILCGLCMRICREIIGVDAIGFANRGHKRKVTTPFEIQSDVCLGCGACAFVCPTGAIKIEDVEDKRKIDMWHTELGKVKCERCGRYFFPESAVEYVKRKSLQDVDGFLKLCPDCRKRVLANKLVCGW
jgi:NADH dehydrogenase/NADH:ubiquinone oxidoreductase subunit G